MKRSFEEINRLNMILTKLENIEEEKANPVVLDFKWVAEELRKAWVKDALQSSSEN
uniref:Uncharacterized protein n=1 Tax=viral metagenome TaxID=1070528 RepID=A0A6M3KI56_9ZZZZ